MSHSIARLPDGGLADFGRLAAFIRICAELKAMRMHAGVRARPYVWNGGQQPLLFRAQGQYTSYYVSAHPQSLARETLRAQDEIASKVAARLRASGPQAASEKLHAYFRKAREHRDAIDALIGAAEDRTEEARTGLPWLARATISVSTVMLGVVAFPETAGLRALASVGCGATTALETWSRRSAVARPGEPVLVEALVAGAADAFATASMGAAGHAAAGSGARVGYLALGFFARANQGFLPSVLRGEALSAALGEAGAAMLADAPNVVGPLQELNGRIAQRLARESLITRIPTRLTRLIPPAQEQVQAAIETACDLTRDTLMAGLEEVTGANVEDAVSGVGSDIAAGGRAGPSGAHPGAPSDGDAGDYRFIERLLANASTTEAEMRTFWLLGRAPESRMSMRGPAARR